LETAAVTFASSHAKITLPGEYAGETDEVLSAARLQIVLTVFANSTVQTAAVTLNVHTLANLGLSGRTNARPADYVYTRAEIEAYINEQGYLWELEHK
jgi:hypothetical protein